jgi:hypothetical protein
MNARDRRHLVLFAISAIVYCPFAQWLTTAPIGTVIFLWLELAYVFALMVAVFAIPVFIIRICFRRTRPQSAAWLVVCTFFIPCCVGGIVLGQRVRSAGMLAFTQRSRPLIAAIEKYEQDHSVPPPTLDALVPHYLPAIPTTGMMAYPEYEYHTGVDARREYAGNPWALSVSTPSGGINFDTILYFPNQNYPKHGYGGWLEPIGDWAYVHE